MSARSNASHKTASLRASSLHIGDLVVTDLARLEWAMWRHWFKASAFSPHFEAEQSASEANIDLDSIFQRLKQIERAAADRALKLATMPAMQSLDAFRRERRDADKMHSLYDSLDTPARYKPPPFFIKLPMKMSAAAQDYFDTVSDESRKKNLDRASLTLRDAGI